MPVTFFYYRPNSTFVLMNEQVTDMTKFLSEMSNKISSLPHSVLVIDRHSSYFNMNVKNHQVCIAHLLRNIQYLTELGLTQN